MKTGQNWHFLITFLYAVSFFSLLYVEYKVLPICGGPLGYGKDIFKNPEQIKVFRQDMGSS